ncbi:MAG TPA: hypothetical protein VFE23_01070 [Usitatibacter sp.]|jgi:hypothetical protein|nr:hypothetical protein [Usitatibacter sp.]
MKVLKFEIHMEPSYLEGLLTRRITGVVVNTLPHGAPYKLTLLAGKEGALEITSRSEIVSERREIGLLTFRCTSIAAKGAVEIRTSFCPTTANKLIFRDRDVYAESGVELVDEAGTCRYIVAGAQPMTIATNFSDSARFWEPEYQIEEYERMPLLSGHQGD